ncbi:MAG: sucrose phosphorylase [Chloroflexota bacterium]
MRPGPQLLTYPDSLGGDLPALRRLLDGPLRGRFGGVHVLPPFPSSGDRGFAPLTYREIEPRFGSWADIRALATHHDVLLDLMVNHISRRSAEFRDFEQHGRASRFADLFITLDKVWPDGNPPAAEVARIFLRKPDDPFSTITIGDTGERLRIWTTFGKPDGTSEQVDLDLRSAATRGLIADWFAFFAAQGVSIVRLDAVGYVVKEAGTSCFMVEPGIWEAIDWLIEAAAREGLAVLPEVHDVPATHERLSARGYWTYDFVLPGLTLLAFETGDARRLADHLARSPERQFTTLDTHDGIPVNPDLIGVLTPDEMHGLADVVLVRGGNINRILSDDPPHGVDVHQLNCTYRSALGDDDERYLAARAIQLFAKGVPQVYYVGLLGGRNDHAAVAATGEGRAVNRHDYTVAEIDAALEEPMVRRLLDLVRLRREHPAFDGPLEVAAPEPHRLVMRRTAGAAACCLQVDLRDGTFSVEADRRVVGA